MNLKRILLGIEGIRAKGDIDIEINAIEEDSRNIKSGDLFLAVKGFVVDGAEYIGEAVKKGAKAVVVSEDTDYKSIKLPEGVTLIVVPDVRKAMAIGAANFYNNPSKRFKLVGVTGTKGKTTTTYMIKEICEKQGYKVGLIGTIENYIAGKSLGDSENTTPGSIELQKLFSQMVKAKCDIVVMEVSSQSLKLDRVYGSDFDIGVFTNLSEDHISPKEHADMQEYFEAKCKLFDMCKTGFINADDLYIPKLLKRDIKCEMTTYGIDNFCNLLAKDVTITNSYVDFKAKLGERNERIKTGIPGRFSVYNSLAAIMVSQKLGCSIENIKEALLEVRVPGRSELVSNKKELTIMIDYAHTPESLENILSAVKSYTRGRVISVFGCGGDRDSAKRPIMGEISGRVADYTIITTDNPRTERPEEIIDEIEEGIKKTKGNYKIVVDRTEAIKEAIKMANKIDIVVLAGKGHEPYQEINGKKYPFDERVIINNVIEEILEEEKQKGKKKK